MFTVGSAVSSVTVRVSVDVFPAVSVARTVSTLEPPASATPATDQVPAPRVAAVNAPPLFDHSTVEIPTLSDTVPLSGSGVVAVTKAGFEVGPVIVTLGTVMSSVITMVYGDEAFPDVSDDVRVTKFAPIASGTEAVQDVVPVAVPLPPVAAFAHVTEATATLSDADPVRLTGDAFVEKSSPPPGVRTTTVGRVLSRVTVIVSTTEKFPASSFDRTWIVFAPTTRLIDADQEV